MNTEKTSVNWYAHGARYYDPQLSRWHSSDPLSELYTSFSPYHYVANNPVNFVDPNGMSQMSSQVHNQLDIENGRGNYNWEMANKMAGMMGSQFGGTSGGYEYSGNPGSGTEVGTHFDWRTGKNYKVYEDPFTGDRYYRSQSGTETWWEDGEIYARPTYSYTNLPNGDLASSSQESEETGMEAAAASLAGVGFVAVLEPSFVGEIAAGLYATYLIARFGPDVVQAAMDMTQNMIDNMSKGGRGNIWPDSYPKPNIPDIDWGLSDSQLATGVTGGGAPGGPGSDWNKIKKWFRDTRRKIRGTLK